MKKIISIISVCVIIFGGVSGVAMNADMDTLDAETTSKSMTIDFTIPTLVEGDNSYVQLFFDEEGLYIMNPGQPMLPRVLNTVELPFGVRNVRVEVAPKRIQEMTISDEIMPSPAPAPLSPMKGYIVPPRKDGAIYRSSNPFPSSWYSYNVGCGLNADGKHVTFVIVNIYPIRYAPAIGKIYIAGSADITVTFDNPEKAILPKTSEYDLVIISPSTFSSILQKLVDHKNNHNVKTFIKTTEEIYREYAGADKPEQVKYFIKDAVETWGIKHVLLVGGLKSLIYAKPRDHVNYGAEGWHIPVRYSNLISGEPGYLCDLYYADIYKEGGEFDNWDSNGNGIFAEWTNEYGPPEDILDLYPDVAVGRLACRNAQEVEDAINKIIYYESSTHGSEWFNKIIAISGDGFLDQQDLDFQWDTNSLPNGEYTIYAQSTNDEDESGPID
ncbi:MAG: C25 family cysteine peptidase, partial [Candidatus Thermoplasmatota archaeon]|nr:C25 family cysteine peptidase [Candidatus Thermoplasmatota archaeon]